MTAGGDPSPNGAPTPPPPRPPAGSPFGRFLQNPVLLIGFVALLVSVPVIALAIGGGGGGSSAGPASTPTATEAVIGDWTGTLGESEVALTIRGAEGELTRMTGGTTCRGTLRQDSTMGRSVEFAHRGGGGCPRRSTIVLSVVADDRLRIDELRGDRLVAEGTLTAR